MEPRTRLSPWAVLAFALVLAAGIDEDSPLFSRQAGLALAVDLLQDPVDLRAEVDFLRLLLLRVVQA